MYHQLAPLAALYRAGLTVVAALVSYATSAVAQEHPASAHRHPEAQQLHNPVPSTSESFAAGKDIYSRYCRTCHGRDGRGQTDMVEFLSYPPADLTDDAWRHGSSDGEVFAITWSGTSEDMESFADRLTEEQVWHVVNYIRTLSSTRRRSGP